MLEAIIIISEVNCGLFGVIVWKTFSEYFLINKLPTDLLDKPTHTHARIQRHRSYDLSVGYPKILWILRKDDAIHVSATCRFTYIKVFLTSEFCMNYNAVFQKSTMQIP